MLCRIQHTPGSATQLTDCPSEEIQIRGTVCSKLESGVAGVTSMDTCKCSEATR